MKGDTTGYYYCENCNVYINVLTASHDRGYTYARIIKKCPHCKGKELKIINYSIFNEIKNKLWIRVTRNKVRYSLKFGVKSEIQ